MNEHNAITYFGITNGRVPHKTFGIKQADRLFHLYAIGRTGAGKSTLIETLALQDIHSGRGCALIDPHGDLAERLAVQVPPSRRGNFVYFNVPNLKQPYGYNPLRRVHKDKIPLAASGLLEALKKLWSDAWGVRMEHLLRNTLYALLEYGDATLPDVLRMFTDEAFRHEVLQHVQNPQVFAFWTNEYPKQTPAHQKDAAQPIQNKIGAFLADPRLYRILTTPEIDLSLRQIMDEGKVLIVNLAKGELGEDSANLLGALLISTISVAAFSRVRIPEGARRPFFLYIDEFQNFTTLALANMVSELRKYKVGLVLAHQHLHQLEPDVRHAVLANMGTLIVFRLGPEDAPIMARELSPVFEMADLLNLPAHDVAVKLLIDSHAARPFSATILHPNDITLFMPLKFG
ncbi:MAG: type IV secretory system conjugative DNA transfer family protein [Leptothrix sp. (in: b-proteobacteria)]